MTTTTGLIIASVTVIFVLVLVSQLSYRQGKINAYTYRIPADPTLLEVNEASLTKLYNLEGSTEFWFTKEEALASFKTMPNWYPDIVIRITPALKIDSKYYKIQGKLFELPLGVKK